jgi:hypothetical protein
MARTPSAMRMRITVPTHHAVLRHMERLEEGTDANAELLRLAELGAHLEDLHGPIKSVADIVKLIHSRDAAAAVPTPETQPTMAARVEPRREVQSVDHAEPAAPIAAGLQPVAPAMAPVPAEPTGGLVVDASQAALAWLPD